VVDYLFPEPLTSPLAFGNADSSSTGFFLDNLNCLQTNITAGTYFAADAGLEAVFGEPGALEVEPDLFLLLGVPETLVSGGDTLGASPGRLSLPATTTSSSSLKASCIAC
jgi:hypothetical protein